MGRLTRRTWINFSLETTPGSEDGTLFPVLAIDPDFKIDRDLVDRNVVRPFLGGSDQLPAARRSILKFKTEMAGSGVRETPPQWGQLLQACGFAQTIFASGANKRVEYNPVSLNFKTARFFYVKDSMRYKSRGALGTVTINMGAYAIPMLEWEFHGFDAAAQDASNTPPTYEAWKRPLVLTDANAADIRFGGTFASGVPSGGIKYPSLGLNINVGNTISHRKMLGGESIDITKREVTGEATLELTPAQEIEWRDSVNAASNTTMTFSTGIADGDKVIIYAPQVQRVDPQEADVDGNMMLKTELRLLPVSGNDELIIVTQ